MVASGAAIAGPPRNQPRLKVRQLELKRPASKDTVEVHRVVSVGVPAGWTGELEALGRAIRLYGPEGEGKMLVAAALHPSELGVYLDQLKREHPSAAPTPPERIALPNVRTELGERATRFAIGGREVGEMVLIEKLDSIVLIVTVVDPNVWPRVRRILTKTYATVDIRDAPKGKSTDE